MKDKASVGKLIPVTLPGGECRRIPYEKLLEWCPMPRTVIEGLWNSPLSDAERCQVYEAVFARYLYFFAVELPPHLEARVNWFWTVMEDRRQAGLSSKGVKKNGEGDDRPKPSPRKKGKKAESVDTPTDEMPQVPQPTQASPDYAPPQYDDCDDGDEMPDPPTNDNDPELNWDL